MSRIPRLPEETLHEILSLCMTPSKFFVHYGDSDRPDNRHTQLLLVCKQWLRIGTPILYRYLRLTDQEQTKTVGHLLAANKGLGLAIRVLRLEGGMGRELHMILSRAPNVETLYVTRYYLLCTDSVAGLRRSIPSMNIKRLYWERAVGQRGNKTTRDLEELMVEAIRDHWRELKLVGFIFDFLERIPMETMQLLACLPCLEQVEFNSIDVEDLIEAGTLVPLQSLPRLKTVRIHGQRDEADVRDALARRMLPEFAKKFEFVKARHDMWYFHDPRAEYDYSGSGSEADTMFFYDGDSDSDSDSEYEYY